MPVQHRHSILCSSSVDATDNIHECAHSPMPLLHQHDTLHLFINMTHYTCERSHAPMLPLMRWSYIYLDLHAHPLQRAPTSTCTCAHTTRTRPQHTHKGKCNMQTRSHAHAHTHTHMCAGTHSYTNMHSHTMCPLTLGHATGLLCTLAPMPPGAP